MTNPFCFDELLLAHFFFLHTHTQYIFGLFFKKRKYYRKKVFVLWQSAHCHHQFIISEREYYEERRSPSCFIYREKKWFKQIEIGRSGRRKTWIMSDYIFIHLPHGVDLRLGRRVAHRLTGKERAFSFFLEVQVQKLKNVQNLKKMTMPGKGIAWFMLEIVSRY